LKKSGRSFWLFGGNGKIQLPLKLICPLSEYDSKTKDGTWIFSCFKNCCPICHRPDCARLYAFYFRPAYDEKNRFIPALIIARYECRTNRAKKKKSQTFSLLPDCLCPYRKYSIKITVQCVTVWQKYKQKISKTVKNIFLRDKDADEKLFNLEAPHISEFINLFKATLIKYRLWKNISREYGLVEFISLCGGNKYQQSVLLAREYYEGNGGVLKNSQFLFGKASQFRAGTRPG